MTGWSTILSGTASLLLMWTAMSGAHPLHVVAAFAAVILEYVAGFNDGADR